VVLVVELTHEPASSRLPNSRASRVDLAQSGPDAVAVPSTHVHYDEHGRVEAPRRRTLRIVLVIVAVVVVVWLIGYTLFIVGGMIPGTGTGDVVTTP
jgi:hypothetical protein